MVEGSGLTHKQLEHKLSQRIMGLYLTYLGHQPNKVSCQLVDKTLNIVIEDAITLPEQLLTNSGQADLASQVRSNIQKAVEVHLKSIIEEVYAITVDELLSNFALDTGRSSIIAILATTPKIATKQQTGSATDSDG